MDLLESSHTAPLTLQCLFAWPDQSVLMGNSWTIEQALLLGSGQILTNGLTVCLHWVFITFCRESLESLLLSCKAKMCWISKSINPVIFFYLWTCQKKYIDPNVFSRSKSQLKKQFRKPFNTLHNMLLLHQIVFFSLFLQYHSGSHFLCFSTGSIWYCWLGFFIPPRLELWPCWVGCKQGCADYWLVYCNILQNNKPGGCPDILLFGQRQKETQKES